ncbi:hypothetical protein SAMN04488134_10336 [Amphibacillus marinus]|uniref:GIY-YIG domain-containing protein n=1 Tax=Amphibacillus marinus TaxID=872970 RepID=A0A1H8L0L7_9BACI|nr:hypothetical protein [Amphibacillus marinus]SEN98675.1 hypothetical protein SAMN04488134_10336 [Amphibacillus marinus]
MENNNESLKWVNKISNIKIDSRILDYKIPIRGIYAIFVKNEDFKGENKYCLYVGRSVSIYGRMFDSNDGHIAKIRDKRHFINVLNKASDQDNIEVFIEVLEEVPLVYNNYYKDMQRLASAENYYINKYQSIDQCLNQVPEGSKMSKEEWENKKRTNVECLLKNDKGKLNSQITNVL